MPASYAYFPAKRIAVLSGGELIGDALMKITFLRALRAAWPRAEIHWVTTQDTTPFAHTLRHITAPMIDVVDDRPRWIAEKNGQAPAFDLVIDTRNKWKEALQAHFLLPHKLFIASAFRYLLSDRRPPLLKPKRKHLIDKLLQMVELASGAPPKLERGLPIPHELMERARRILPEGQIYIGFAPGAGGAIKKWPLERFEKLAQLQARIDRVPVFLLGPQEMDIYDQLFRLVPEAIFPLQAREVWGTRDITVDQTLAIGSLLALAVTNDSGTSHMLGAVDCPLVSLFGPTGAEKLAPKVTHREVITAQSFGGTDMALIPVETVNEAIQRLLLKTGRI